MNGLSAMSSTQAARRALLSRNEATYLKENAQLAGHIDPRNLKNFLCFK
jgi:hypothetical protein